MMGAAPSATVSRVIMEMADADDGRIPIVRYASSDPEELLNQAQQLAGQPTQADLRRAVSSALFHFLLTAAADMIVGADKRHTLNYTVSKSE
jgi:hypothetical protein